MWYDITISNHTVTRTMRLFAHFHLLTFTEHLQYIIFHQTQNTFLKMVLAWLLLTVLYCTVLYWLQFHFPWLNTSGVCSSVCFFVCAWKNKWNSGTDKIQQIQLWMNKVSSKNKVIFVQMPVFLSNSKCRLHVTNTKHNFNLTFFCAATKQSSFLQKPGF